MRYLNQSLRNIHSAIISGKVTPSDLVKEAISLAKTDQNNAFEYICEQEALAAVKQLDSSKIDNLLYGIPVVIKDNYSTRGIPTTASSDILKGYIPVFDAEVVTRLKEQGAIIIGKSTMDELAMGGSGTNGHLGITFNPWDKSHKRIVGGSSCGSAAAISAGIVPVSIGSDTGDSVRKPASYAGLVGFKPTWGRISRYGLYPFAASLDHVAYFTRNVFDSAYLLNVLAGRDNKDSTSSSIKVEDYTSKLSESLKGKRVAIVKEIIESMTDEITLAKFNKTVPYFKESGAIVDVVSIDSKILKAIYPTYIIISSAEATSNYASLDGVRFGNRVDGATFEEMISNTRTKGFGEYAKRRFVIGSFSLLNENQEELFLRAQKCRRLIVDSFNEVLKNYDVIYAPASPSIAPYIKSSKNSISDEYLISDNYLAFANMGGFPSITLPIGFEKNMPFGANLTAKPYQEALLLNIASQLEKYTGLVDLVVEDNK